MIKKLFGNVHKENIERMRKSGYFDEAYYAKQCPDMKGDLCSHYYYHGWKEGKSPCYEFSNDFYLENYPDVVSANVNPLLHYITSGKLENRLTKLDNGVSLEEAYEKIYKYAYRYNIYLHDAEEKRITILFETIDETIFGFAALFEHVMKKCQDETASLRIVYSGADFNALKEMLQQREIKLPANTSFLNLKASNYLDVSLGESFVCTSWKTARALLKTGVTELKVYFYLSELNDDLNKEEWYQILNICTDEKVTILTDQEENLKKIKKCSLVFEENFSDLHDEKKKNLHCKWEQSFIVGMELLNQYFMEGKFQHGEWQIEVLAPEIDWKFHVATQDLVESKTAFTKEADMFFTVSYDKKPLQSMIPYIHVYVEEEEFDVKRYHLTGTLK